MISFLSDEDFNGRIIRGLLRRLPELDLVTANGVGLDGQEDPVLAAWAAEQGRVILTHDVNTMVDAARERVRLGSLMPGVVAVPQQIGIGAAISDIELIATCADREELVDQVWYLPL